MVHKKGKRDGTKLRCPPCHAKPSHHLFGIQWRRALKRIRLIQLELNQRLYRQRMRQLQRRLERKRRQRLRRQERRKRHLERQRQRYLEKLRRLKHEKHLRRLKRLREQWGRRQRQLAREKRIRRENKRKERERLRRERVKLMERLRRRKLERARRIRKERMKRLQMMKLRKILLERKRRAAKRARIRHEKLMRKLRLQQKMEEQRRRRRAHQIAQRLLKLKRERQRAGAKRRAAIRIRMEQLKRKRELEHARKIEFLRRQKLRIANEIARKLARQKQQKARKKQRFIQRKTKKTKRKGKGQEYEWYTFHNSWVGCFSDKPERAMGKMIQDLRSHRDPIGRCSELAVKQGYQVFGVQDGGQCFFGPKAHITYDKYGTSKQCKDLKGGKWANDVYEIKDGDAPPPIPHKEASSNTVEYIIEYVGCFKDDARDHAVGRKVATFRGKDAVDKCSEEANKRKLSYFALQNGGDCYTGPSAAATYMKYGASKGCKGETGGVLANSVFVIRLGKSRRPHPSPKKTHAPFMRRTVGCYKDRPNSPAMGKKIGDFRGRKDPVKDCFEAAAQGGFHAFGLQNGGECFSDVGVEKTFQRYGSSHKCSAGLGGYLANNVYMIIKGVTITEHTTTHTTEEIITTTSTVSEEIVIEHAGCYKDDARVPAVGTKVATFRGIDAVDKCSEEAAKRKFSYFALQNGVDCYTGRDAEKTYNIYGTSAACKDGRGGVLANDVYVNKKGNSKQPHKASHSQTTAQTTQTSSSSEASQNSFSIQMVGCFKDNIPHALDVELGDFKGKPDSVIQECFEAAVNKKYTAFAVQNGGKCFSSPSARTSYKRYGNSSDCREDVGGKMANSVFFISQGKRSDAQVDVPVPPDGQEHVSQDRPRHQTYDEHDDLLGDKNSGLEVSLKRNTQKP
ncbi:predicted protein [Nematostella vectensis]|uniref:WSC domain-containing protein n=1 Tax=Nematostella vectensis TaxID=45351 RepID=A7RFD4_NEMVE|nr:predicted protein [Nematostella vectensis]|eukprot:XP_001642139.1 predicted protein [Nematostella vectensis]